MVPYEIKEKIMDVRDLALSLPNSDGGLNVILRDINVSISNIYRPELSQGQVIGILGPSGIGKTQFFRTLSGLQKPTRGEVFVGVDLKPVRLGQVGVVFQNYPIDERLTAIRTLIRAGRQAGLSRADAKAKAMGLLEKFGLIDKADYYPAQLSGGQCQRVAIAEQLMCSEHFLLMDEPFSGLDYLSKQNACDLITGVATADELNTIVVVSHDIETTMAIADTLWLMGRDRDAEGKVIPGARIIETVDLIQAGIAWQPGIQLTPQFADLARQIKARFSDPKGPYTK